MNIAIVEDMPVDAEILRAQLIAYASQKRLVMDIHCFASAEELLEEYHPLKYTVVFLDIFMNGMNGVEAARKLREADSDTLLVFLTASKEHMPDAFKVHAYDYIEKPSETHRLYALMDDILKHINREAEIPRLNFVSRRQEYSLPYSEIVSIVTIANYLEITDSSGDVSRARMTFTAAAEQLTKDQRFLMIMRGILVNMDYVTGISDNTCRLSDGRQLPVTVKSSKKIEQTWKNYCFSQNRKDPLKRTGED